MNLSVKVHLSYTAPQPCDLLLQIEVAAGADQELVAEQLHLASDLVQHRVDGEDGIGQRFWVKAQGDFECQYEAMVSVDRKPVNLDHLTPTPLNMIPGDVIKYLMPSRYCHPEVFFDFTSSQFNDLTGGNLVAGMRDWIKENFTYDPGGSHAFTTAGDSFESRVGVCRDYAHVLIAMVRAVGIPARIVSGYAPDVSPQDFHAVAEVYLDGNWHIVDPTGMARADEFIRVGVGRDAADVSFMTSYGAIMMKNQSVQVTRAK